MFAELHVQLLWRARTATTIFSLVVVVGGTIAAASAFPVLTTRVTIRYRSTSYGGLVAWPEPQSSYATSSSASTNASRVRVTSGQSRLKSATSRFRSEPAIARGLVGELIHRVMQRGIGEAPLAPCLHGTERFHGIRQMLARIPGVERLAFGGIGHGGANDEEGSGHVSLQGVVLAGWAKRSGPTRARRAGRLRFAQPTYHTLQH